MSWVKLDDNFPDHPKMLAAGPLAMILHVKALCYAARYATSGFVPTEAALTMVDWTLYGVLLSEHEPDDPRGLPRYPCNLDLVEELVRVGAWEEAPGGYKIHDFGVYNPPRGAADLASQRSEAGRRGAAARWDGKRRVANGKPMAKTSAEMANDSKPMAKAMATVDGKPDFANGKPMPRARASDPDPDPVPHPLISDPPVAPQGAPPPKVERKTRKPAASPMPEGWAPNEGVYAVGREVGLDAKATDRELRRFADFHASKGARFLDWQAAARTWLRNVPSFQRPGSAPLAPLAADGARRGPREPTRAELAQMELDGERHGMSPADPDKPGELPTLGMLAGRER